MPYPLSELSLGCSIGEFKVVELYPEGRGGMARVVKVKPANGKASPVALKISRVGSKSTYFYAAIQKEVEILKKLKHKGVVRLAQVSKGKNPYKERAVEVIGSPWFFGMECLRGGSLESYMRGLGPLSLFEAAAICHQLSKALEYIHARGFAHNDIKPDNILFRYPLRTGDRLEAVLIDFGVSTKLIRHQTDGSVVYMAPERLQESRCPSPPEMAAGRDLAKGDVWSLGILFYRMLAGREPFLGITDHSITSAILRSIPTSIIRKRQDIPKAIDEFIIDGCLAKSPALRVSMSEFNRFIDRYSGDWRVRRVSKPKRRFPWQH